MKHHIIRNNKGLSLTELLVTIGVVTILSSVAVVQYGGYETTTQKQQLLSSARLFVMKVKSCLTNLSSQLDQNGWSITRGSKTMRPCQANDHAKLKKKLGYNCPVAGTGDNDNRCNGRIDDSTNPKFHCLEIRKVVKGKKHQVFIKFDIKEQSAKIYCKIHDNSNYASLANLCSGSANPQDWNGLNTDCQCEWPKDSLAGTCPSSTPVNTPGNTGGNGNGGNSNTPPNPSTPEQNGNNQQQGFPTQ